MKGFKSVNAYIEGRGIIKTDVAFENGIITKIGDNLPIDEVIEVEASSVVCPGFIDEHIHGAFGADGMDGSVEQIGKIAKAVASEGVTAFLVTTMTQSKENIENALKAVDEYAKANSAEGAAVLGVHLEGPFISKKRVGAQPPEYVATPSVETFKEYEEASGGRIKVVSLAPEVEGADELISYLASKKIVPSAGHTDAAYKDVKKAVSLGLRSVTHTYNAQTPVHHREVGVVGSALLLDELNCEMIADCIHVCPEAMKLIVKNKPKNKVTLITDSMRAKHLPDGESELGGQKVFVKNGEARLADGTLAGSVLKMNDAIANVVNKVGADFTDAVDFASRNPAENLFALDERGSIAVGKVADFAVLRPDFSVETTIRGGNVIYRADH